MAQALKDLMVAIGSGKGGVGKSTTSANLAVLAAREGLRVGLVDLDPLSDLGVVFDLPREVLAKARAELVGAAGLDDYTVKLFPRLDLLFPHVKLRRGESDALRALIFERFPAELASRYDLVVLDMPAGIGQEENLSFLPHLQHVVIVCNAEPTSHVSAGGYVKAASEINPRLRFYVWHNKFETAVNPEFNPRTLVENYNRYVPEDLRLEPEIGQRLGDVAFVPFDASLNLLLAEGEYQNQLLGKFVELLELLDEQALAELPPESGVPKPLRVVVRHRLRHAADHDLDSCVAYVGAILGRPDFQFPADQRLYLEKYLKVQAAHPLRNRIRLAAEAVRRLLDRLSSAGSMFAPRGEARGAEIQRLRNQCAIELRGLVDYLARCHEAQNQARAPWPRANAPMVKNLSGLLLFYFCLYRLFEAPAVQGLVGNFVPHRRLPDGRRQRSRYRQIAMVIQEDRDYHLRFFALIKRLFPLCQRQIALMAKNGNWQPLLFRDGAGAVKHNAYLKLLTKTVHDLVNGGLGVHVGVRHNAAAQAIQEGGRALFARMRVAKPVYIQEKGQ